MARDPRQPGRYLADTDVVAGSLGAISGDSALFWIARQYGREVEPMVTDAQANSRVHALVLMDSSAPALIVGGRYVPGMRFVGNAPTRGFSEISYRRSLRWSVGSGVLWSAMQVAMEG